jgi:hypothetical protein
LNALVSWRDKCRESFMIPAIRLLAQELRFSPCGN